jgi:deoxycytidine triphosphate deaminase
MASFSLFNGKYNVNSAYAFNFFMNKMMNDTCHDRFMHLKIFVDHFDAICEPDADVGSQLKQAYIAAANNHNQKMIDDPHFFDAGFDLLMPYAQNFSYTDRANKVDFKVKCCAKIHFLNSVSVPNTRSYFTGFYVHPRSSISKTPVRLANSTGIIDAGYRGNLIGMFDCTNDMYSVEAYTRLLQICAPSLMPIYVEIVDSIDDLGPSTSRGTGGIGSTGI